MQFHCVPFKMPIRQVVEGSRRGSDGYRYQEVRSRCVSHRSDSSARVGKFQYCVVICSVDEKLIVRRYCALDVQRGQQRKHKRLENHDEQFQEVESYGADNHHDAETCIEDAVCLRDEVIST